MLLVEERRRLKSARLWAMTEAMTQVSIAAGRKLPSWEVRPEDVPSPCGLMMFDTPIGYYRADPPGEASQMVSIVAVSWGPTRIVETPANHLWVTFWSLTHHEIGIRLLRSNGYRLRDARRLQHSMGDFTWDNEVLLAYNEAEVSVINSHGETEAVDPSNKHLAANTTIEWIQTVRAAWLMMKRDAKRPIAEVEELPLSKTERKQLQRRGYNDDPVRVVGLHQDRRPRASRERESGYTVTVRSHVTGHVRWQPYPSKGVIEPIWIEEHVRGPKDAPWSQQKTTVTVVDRPPGGRPPVNRK
ncbi:hypothetical protein CVV72_10785 [Amycolatopsis sp. TNS106]|nr:hypothetical protein CVV72_10785 [Amycolatopsis sp. TNS106]